jgi:hypothetical protein
MCSLFLVLRTLSTTAVRFTKKKTHQRLLLWEVSVMQQRRAAHKQACSIKNNLNKFMSDNLLE